MLGEEYVTCATPHCPNFSLSFDSHNRMIFELHVQFTLVDLMYKSIDYVNQSCGNDGYCSCPWDELYQFHVAKLNAPIMECSHELGSILHYKIKVTQYQIFEMAVMTIL